MMILKFGDQWSAWQRAGLFLITTNASTHIDLDGLDPLVMGAGIARQARDRFEGLDVRLSQIIRGRPQTTKSRFYYRNHHYYSWHPPYHLLVSPRWPQAKLGLFQTKERFCDRASLTLIEQGVEALCRWCVQHPGVQVHMNFPGIGHGGLKLGEVEPLVLRLPDNVHVWQHRRATRVVHCKKEPYDVYIGRSSKWGNPFRKGTRRELVEQYKAWVVRQPDLMAALPELKGKTLGCWCKPKPCHGDVLAELAERMVG